MIYYEKGGPQHGAHGPGSQRRHLTQALEKLGSRKKVLAIPPDITRYYSKAGLLTEFAWEYYGEDSRISCLPWEPMQP